MIEPFTIATVAADPGRIGICRLPGRSGALAEDLSAIENWRPALVVSLTPIDEMEALGAGDLKRGLSELGLGWRHFPIEDFGVPAAAEEGLWRALADELHAALDAGEGVLLHCRGGLGRSGMVAARLLAERGAAGAEAVARVRANRPGAVETDAQELWAGSGVRRIPPRASADRPPPAA